jgi:hypothetical protein
LNPTLTDWFCVRERGTALDIELHGADLHDARRLVYDAWKSFAGGTPAKRRRAFGAVRSSVPVYPPMFKLRADTLLASWWSETQDFRRRQLHLFPDREVQSSASVSGSAA